MQTRSAPVSHAKLARFETWARLWLLWFARHLIAAYGAAAPIPRGAERELHAWLDNVARVIAGLVFIRALSRVRVAGPRRGLSNRDLRAAIGCALRQQLRRGSLSQRIETLRAALASLDAYAAKLARRLRRGLRLGRAIGVRRQDGATLALAPHGFACVNADTS